MAASIDGVRKHWPVRRRRAGTLGKASAMGDGTREAKPFKGLYPDLDGMMKRRHRIEHRRGVHLPESTRARSSSALDVSGRSLFQLGLWV